MEKDNYNLIEKYLNGELTEEEIKSFRIRLQEDDLFKEEYELQKSMNTFLEKDRNQTALESKLETIGDQFFLEEKKEKIIPIHKNKNRWLIGLITAAAVATILFIFNPFQQKDLYNQYAVHQNLSLTEKSNESDDASKAQIAYNQKDYRLAYEYLTLYLENDPVNSKALLALGSSALEIGEQKEAISIFEKISKGNSTLKNYGTWYLALSYLKDKDIQKTKFYLRQIPDSENILFQNAQELLKDLE